MLLLGGLGFGVIVLTLTVIAGKKGKGSRDLYYGFGGASALIAVLAFVLTGPPPDTVGTTLFQRQSASLINRFAPPFALALGCVAAGCLIGGYVFPRPARGRRRHRDAKQAADVGPSRT